MDSQMGILFIPLLGFGIIIFCILSFFLPYGEKFKGKIQKIKGFGVNLEISIFTLFIIIGVILSLTGVYLQITDYEQQLNNSKKEEEAAKIALAQANKMEMRVVVSLEGVSENDMPKLEDVKCKYFLPGSDRHIEADVIKGVAQGTFKIILKDVTSRTHVLRLVLEDNATNRKWEKMNFMPLEPVFSLKKE
jgi:predicted membrane protein